MTLEYISLVLLLLFLIIQLVFSLYFFTSIILFKNTATAGSSTAVSVIVCAHNELENLQKLLPLLFDQSHSNFEVIVVNDRSTDETEFYLKDIKEQHGSRIKVLTVTDTPPKMDPKKYALTLGIKAATHDKVLLTDADCYPADTQWIQQMALGFNNKKSIVLGVSQYEKQKGFLNLCIRYETLYTAIQYLSFAIRNLPYMGIGRNSAYLKTLFFENKGFHPYNDVTGGDDDLFINRVATADNTSVVLTPESQTISYPKKTWGEWYRQKTRHMAVSKLYKPTSKIQLGLLHASHFGTYGAFMVAVIQNPLAWWVYSLFFTRLLLNWIIFSKIITKLRYNISMWAIPMFDILFLFYYIATGFNALRTKRIRWK